MLEEIYTQKLLNGSPSHGKILEAAAFYVRMCVAMPKIAKNTIMIG